MIDGHRPLLVAVAALGLTAACAERPGLRVLEVLPAAEDGPLRRNEAITILLDREVDPSSATAAAVRVLRPDGGAARGRLETKGRRVRFVPHPGREPTWDDGGYGAGRGEIRLVLPGFPARGLLAADGGAPLPATFERQLPLAVPPGGAPSPSSFRDLVPGGPRLVRPPAPAGDDVVVAEGGGIELHFSEPLFPPIQAPVTIRFDDRDRTPLPTATELRQGEQDAVLTVRPVEGFRSGTRYLLELRPEALTDLVGNPFDGRGLPREYGVRVVPAAGEEGS